VAGQPNLNGDIVEAIRSVCPDFEGEAFVEYVGLTLGGYEERGSYRFASHLSLKKGGYIRKIGPRHADKPGIDYARDAFHRRRQEQIQTGVAPYFDEEVRKEPPPAAEPAPAARNANIDRVVALKSCETGQDSRYIGWMMANVTEMVVSLKRYPLASATNRNVLRVDMVYPGSVLFSPIQTNTSYRVRPGSYIYFPAELSPLQFNIQSDLPGLFGIFELAFRHENQHPTTHVEVCEMETSGCVKAGIAYFRNPFHPENAKPMLECLDKGQAFDWGSQQCVSRGGPRPPC
jgi:hypothetical protein